MKTKISNIATIRLGYHFRGKIIADSNGAISVIQMKDINEDLTIGWDSLMKVAQEKYNEAAYVHEGEILFANRGNANYAAVVDQDRRNAIAVSNFFIIKLKTDRVTPEYLTWYINQRLAQKYFDQHRAGSYIPTMRGEWLNELQVSVPPLDIQKKVVELDRLQKKEADLCMKIQKKKTEIIEIVLNRKIKE